MAAGSTHILSKRLELFPIEVDRRKSLAFCFNEQLLIAFLQAIVRSPAGSDPIGGADLLAGVRSVIGTAARRGMDANQAIQQTPRNRGASYPG